jgi:hypothetical protein
LRSLREATHAEIQHNRAINRNNTSGFPGVWRGKRDGQWRASIGFGGRQHHLGRFKDPELAYHRYLAAKKYPTSPVPRGKVSPHELGLPLKLLKKLTAIKASVLPP